MTTQEKLNKIASELFQKTYSELPKNQRDIAFKQYLKENAVFVRS